MLATRRAWASRRFAATTPARTYLARSARSADLKQQPGANLLKFGTGSFSVTLMQHGLIDELHLWRFPVIAGTADSIFDGLPLTHLQLLDTTTFGSGIVVQVLGPKSA